MHTENVIYIDAPMAAVFDLAVNIEQWPAVLPHYRYVRKVADGGKSRFARGPVYAMKAMRTGFPCSWTSIQEIDWPGKKITYHHVAGVTAGMDVVWRFEPDQGLTRVVIHHDLSPRWFWLKPFPISWIVGRHFVMHIAQKTLAGIKARAERTQHGIAVAP